MYNINGTAKYCGSNDDDSLPLPILEISPLILLLLEILNFRVQRRDRFRIVDEVGDDQPVASIGWSSSQSSHKGRMPVHYIISAIFEI